MSGRRPYIRGVDAFGSHQRGPRTPSTATSLVQGQARKQDAIVISINTQPLAPSGLAGVDPEHKGGAEGLGGEEKSTAPVFSGRRIFAHPHHCYAQYPGLPFTYGSLALATQGVARALHRTVQCYVQFVQSTGNGCYRSDKAQGNMGSKGCMTITSTRLSAQDKHSARRKVGTHGSASPSAPSPS